VKMTPNRNQKSALCMVSLLQNFSDFKILAASSGVTDTV
jgi:hypothetical protein